MILPIRPKNFDRSKVKGLVASLITLKEPAAATALEVYAGGKLYQVVVDNANTGKLLLTKGRLQRRVTIIPLDKVKSRPLTNAKLARAQQVASRAEKGAKVNLALSLVGYAPEVDKAMQYVFGNGIVCTGSGEAAKQVCFDPEVKCKTITLEGDMFDPQGTLSGGSSNRGRGSVLLRLQKLNAARQEVAALSATLAKLDSALKGLAQKAKEFAKLSSKVELARHDLRLTEELVGQSQHGALQTQIAESVTQLEEEKGRQETAKAAEKAATARCSELRAEIADLVARREREMKEMEVKVAQKKKDLAKAGKAAAKAKEASRSGRTRTPTGPCRGGRNQGSNHTGGRVD